MPKFKLRRHDYGNNNKIAELNEGSRVFFHPRASPIAGSESECIQDFAFTQALASLLRQTVDNHRINSSAEKCFTLVLLKPSMTSPSPRKSKLGFLPRPFKSCALTAFQPPRAQASRSSAVMPGSSVLKVFEDSSFYLVAGVID